MTRATRFRSGVETVKYWLLALTLFFIIPAGAAAVVGLIP